MEIDFCPLKPLIKLFIRAVVLRDVVPTIDYPKKLGLGSILKALRSTKIGPRFMKTGAEGVLRPYWQA